MLPRLPFPARLATEAGAAASGLTRFSGFRRALMEFIAKILS
jgi:hypothetical protein